MKCVSHMASTKSFSHDKTVSIDMNFLIIYLCLSDIFTLLKIFHKQEHSR